MVFVGRFTHSMPCPCWVHAVPLPCLAAKGLECVFPIRFTQCGRVWFTLAIPRPCHAPTMPFFSRSQHSTAVERHFVPARFTVHRLKIIGNCYVTVGAIVTQIFIWVVPSVCAIVTQIFIWVMPFVGAIVTQIFIWLVPSVGAIVTDFHLSGAICWCYRDTDFNLSGAICWCYRDRFSFDWCHLLVLSWQIFIWVMPSVRTIVT